MPQLVITGSVGAQRAIFVGELPFKRLNVIELDHATQQIFGQAGTYIVVRAQFELTVSADMRQGLVEATVVASVHRQDFWASCQGAANADWGFGIERFGCGHCNLPERQTEAAAQLLTDAERIFGRHHHDGHPLPHLLRDGLGRCLRGVPKHRAGVAEQKIDIFVAVDIGHPIAAGFTDKNRVRSSPIPHPRHRNAVEQHFLSLVESLFRFWVCDEIFWVRGHTGLLRLTYHARKIGPRTFPPPLSAGRETQLRLGRGVSTY